MQALSRSGRARGAQAWCLQLNCRRGSGQPHFARADRARTRRRASRCWCSSRAPGLEGKAKTARKGVGGYRLKLRRQSLLTPALISRREPAPSMNWPARSRSIRTFTDLARGITVNTGMIAGGTRTNVIAAEAEAEHRLPDSPPARLGGFERSSPSLQPRDQRCRLELTGELNRPPMERSPAIVRALPHGEELCRGIGVSSKSRPLAAGRTATLPLALGHCDTRRDRRR